MKKSPNFRFFNTLCYKTSMHNRFLGSGDFKFTPKSIPPSPLVPSTPSLTTKPPPITPHVDDIPPDPCFSTIDAVTLIRHEIFMFHV